MWATCHNEECEANGVPIDVGSMSYVNEETGETVTTDQVNCGDCGQQITDISSTAPAVEEEEEEVPPDE